MKRWIVGLMVFAAFRIAAQNIPAEQIPGYRAMNTDDLKAYEAVLTADSLEGRETSYPGQKRAAAYIADEFRSFGLLPMGDDGSYLQHFNVILRKVDPASALTVKAGDASTTYRWGDEFMTDGARDTTLQGPVVFAGFADSKLPSEDGALEGKIVLIFAGGRTAAADTSRMQSMRRLFAQRRDRGIRATLIITDAEGAASFDAVSKVIRDFPPVRGRMTLEGEESSGRMTSTPRIFIAPALASSLLRAAGLTLESARASAQGSPTFAPVTLPGVSVTLDSHMLREERSSENVIGTIEGTDPVLKDQVVVFSAHYDHLGVGSDGRIYRGADDDGSGTSMILELARAFAKNPVRPKRTLLFLTVAGEEKGLLGSKYYTTHPVIPLQRTVADLNIDMIGRVDPAHETKGEVRYVYVIGSDKISPELDSLLRAANDQTERLDFDYKYNDESDPEQLYRRSDHYNFASKGVPVAFFFTGLHADYHQPTDTPDKILYDRMLSIGRVIYATGWKVADFPHALDRKPSGPAQ